MANRSADASIKGYMYQFIHTIKDILDNEDDAINTVEGIEDLDIRNGSEDTLIQYKYHELQHFTNSLVAKPIALMFNHFIKINDKYKYKLVIFMDDDLPNADVDRLKDILALKSAQDYIANENIQYCSDCDRIREFLEFFEWIKTSKYDVVESEIISQMVKQFNVSTEEATIIYLPNAINKVISLGIQNEIEKRKIKTLSFKNYLNSRKKISDIAFTSRIYGETKAVKQILQRIRGDGCKKNNTDIVVYFDDGSKEQLENMIIDIAKRYFYKGNKNDYRPITFIVNEPFELKNKIAKRICCSNEIIVFNDGYEDHFFCKELFNSKAITTNSPQRGKVNDVNYNFRILSRQTFLANKDHIKLNNGTLITVGGIDEMILEGFSRIYHLGNLENSSIVDIIGGCNG